MLLEEAEKKGALVVVLLSYHLDEVGIPLHNRDDELVTDSEVRAAFLEECPDKVLEEVFEDLAVLAAAVDDLDVPRHHDMPITTRLSSLQIHPVSSHA